MLASDVVVTILYYENSIGLNLKVIKTFLAYRIYGGSTFSVTGLRKIVVTRERTMYPLRGYSHICNIAFGDLLICDVKSYYFVYFLATRPNYAPWINKSFAQPQATREQYGSELVGFGDNSCVKKLKTTDMGVEKVKSKSL